MASVLAAHIKNRLPVTPGRARRGPEWLLPTTVFATSVHGGYFGAGQGVILLAAMTLLMTESPHEVNAVKNVLQAVDNLTSATVFAAVAPVDRTVVGLLAVGAVAGGQLGGRYGQKLPSVALRALIVVIGVVGIIQLL